MPNRPQSRRDVLDLHADDGDSGCCSDRSWSRWWVRSRRICFPSPRLWCCVRSYPKSPDCAGPRCLRCRPIRRRRPEQRPAAGAAGTFQVAPVTVVAIFQAGITNMKHLRADADLRDADRLVGIDHGLAGHTISIAGMLAQTPVGWLSDRLDRRVMLLVQGARGWWVAACASIAGSALSPCRCCSSCSSSMARPR